LPLHAARDQRDMAIEMIMGLEPKLSKPGCAESQTREVAWVTVLDIFGHNLPPVCR
jgi:hypothetical protein